jgi:hypothetical protein
LQFDPFAALFETTELLPILHAAHAPPPETQKARPLGRAFEILSILSG